MRNAVLPPLLRILDALQTLFPRHHGSVLHVHAVDGESLRDCVEGVREEA